jgi:hypothetical protein
MYNPWGFQSEWGRGMPEANIGTYLLPGLLAHFTVDVPPEMKDTINEIRLLRDRVTQTIVRGKRVSLYIRAEVNDTEAITGIIESFKNYLSLIGLDSDIVVYHAGWLKDPANKTFADNLTFNSLLLWGRNADEHYITARAAIDYIYGHLSERDIKEGLATECDGLNSFILDVRKLDWLNMQRAIQAAPAIYSAVPSYYYGVIANHVWILCNEYYLSVPKWLGRYYPMLPIMAV